MTYIISYFALALRCLPQEVISQHAKLHSAPPYRIPTRSKTQDGMSSRTQIGMLYWLLENGTLCQTCGSWHVTNGASWKAHIGWYMHGTNNKKI